MKSQVKTDSEKLNFKWDKNAELKLKDSQNNMSFDDYIKFLEQFNPSEEELRQVKVYKTKFTLK